MDRSILKDFLERNTNSIVKLSTVEGQIRTVVKVISLDDSVFSFYDARGALVALPLQKIEEVWPEGARA
jgi:hypothetical protein